MHFYFFYFYKIRIYKNVLKRVFLQKHNFLMAQAQLCRRIMLRMRAKHVCKARL